MIHQKRSQFNFLILRLIEFEFVVNLIPKLHALQIWPFDVADFVRYIQAFIFV